MNQRIICRRQQCKKYLGIMQDVTFLHSLCINDTWEQFVWIYAPQTKGRDCYQPLCYECFLKWIGQTSSKIGTQFSSFKKQKQMLKAVILNKDQQIKNLQYEQKGKIQQMKSIINEKDLKLKLLQQYKDEIETKYKDQIAFENKKKEALDDQLLKKFEHFKISDESIKILLKEELTSVQILAQLQKQDLKHLGIRIKDVLAIQKMFL